MVAVDEEKLREASYRAIGANLLGRISVSEKSETIKVPRTFIRHNADEVAKQLMTLLDK